MFLDLARDEPRFRFRIQGLIVTNLFAGRILCPQRFFFTLDVVFDYATGEVENVLRRTIILFQPNYLRGRKMFFELQNVGNVRAAPAID